MKRPGNFESDESFIWYMQEHSKTERALFRTDYIKYLKYLAGNVWDNNGYEFLSWDYADMKDTLEKAKRR